MVQKGTCKRGSDVFAVRIQIKLLVNSRQLVISIMRREDEEGILPLMAPDSSLLGSLL